jgi:hypothetical protein
MGKQVFLDGVLAKVEFPSRVAIAETPANESHHLFFPRAKELAAIRVEHNARRALPKLIRAENSSVPY